MHIQKRFEDMLVPVSKRIKEECQNNLPNTGKCILPSAYLRSSFELIKKELMETLEIIALIKPNEGNGKISGKLESKK